MPELAFLFIKALVFGIILTGILGFILTKFIFSKTDTAVGRLNKETEDVRKKQSELNEKIKEANEELSKRKEEAEALVTKMGEDAEAKAMEEREKIIKKARADAEEIIIKAEKKKADIRKAIEAEMELKAIDFTVLLLKDLLAGKMMLSFNDSLVEDFIDSLEEIDMTMITAEVTVAEIVVSTPLKEHLHTKLATMLKNKLKREIQLKIDEDKEIIFGIVLKFGSLSLNGGFRHMIIEKGNEIKEKLEKGILERD